MAMDEGRRPATVDVGRIPAGCPWRLTNDTQGYEFELWPNHAAYVSAHEPIEVWDDSPQAAIDSAVAELAAHRVDTAFRPALPAEAADSSAGDAL